MGRRVAQANDEAVGVYTGTRGMAESNEGLNARREFVGGYVVVKTGVEWYASITCPSATACQQQTVVRSCASYERASRHGQTAG